jgi:hypothetical protein
MTQAMLDALEVQNRITSLEKQDVELQAEDSKIGTLIAEINGAARGLRIKLARGDVQAGKALADSDRQLLELAHRREGVRLSREDLRKLIAPLHAEAQQRAEVADQERQGREVQALSRDAERLTNEIIEHWRKGCGAGYALTQLVTEATARNLDELHRSQVLGACSKAGEMILKASADVINEHWLVAQYGGFRPLSIVAANPAGAKRMG